MLGKLAIRTLIYDRGKLVAALVGVIFSVVLVNVQGRLVIGLMSKASLLIDQGNADIWVVAFVGIAAGVIISLAISSLFSTPRSTITIPIYLYFASAALVLVICWFSAIIPYWRVRQIDPHLALQG